MSLRFLLDTSVISEPLRPVPSRNVVGRLRRHDGEIAIARVHELTLVTANEKDFSIFSGLRIVSWA